MNQLSNMATETQKPEKYKQFKLFCMIALACLVGSLLALWVAQAYLFPDELEPVTLNSGEARALNAKLNHLGLSAQLPVSGQAPHSAPTEQPLIPEPYSETSARRDITLTEREVNALLAHNTDLANRLVIDFSENLASAKLLVPLDEDLPLLGGRTLLVSLGFELAYRDERPVVVFKGVSLWGVPVPNAWLGNIKEIDLVREFGDGQGFWTSFAAGIEDLELSDGQLKIRLKD
jgi:hypothetical protein